MSHCLLESVPGLEFMACAGEAHAHEEGDDADRGCQGACCTVEFAKYQVQRHDTLAPNALAPVIDAVAHSDAEPQGDRRGFARLPASPPLELSPTWQFLLRAAPSPRAPARFSRAHETLAA
jgi:hypothetical protein